jgi:hypothetical protein
MMESLRGGFRSMALWAINTVLIAWHLRVFELFIPAKRPKPTPHALA